MESNTRICLIMVCLSILILPTLVMAEAVTFRGKSFATIEIQDIDPNNWKEGQSITITLTDKDANRDPNVAEKLTLPTAYDFTLETKPNVDPTQMMWKKDGAIASLGSANSLRNISSVTLENNSLNYVTNLDYRQDKNIAVITIPDSVISLSSGNSLILSNAVDVPNITKYASEPNISHFINYDIRSLNQKLTGGKINSFSIVLEGNGNSVTLVESTSNFQNYFKISNEKIAEIKNKLITRSSNIVNVKIIFESVAANAQYNPNSVLPIVLDVFSFGVVGKGNQASDYVINAVYRLELEETGANTDTFTGTIAYERITAKNIQTFDFSKLATSGKNIVFPAFPHSVNSDALLVSYYDRGADGIITQIADQQELVGRAVIPPIQITTNEDVPVTVSIGIDDFWKVSNISGGKFLEGEIKVTGLDDKITFIPAPDYFGTTELTIELSESYLPSQDLITQTKLQITVNPVNDPPNVSKLINSQNELISIQQGGWLSTIENTPFEIKYSNVGKNYGSSGYQNTIKVYEPDGDKLTIIIVQPPTKGKITQDTKTTYTSNVGFTGQDSMIIKFSDGKLESENLTVNIFVEPKSLISNTVNQTNSKNDLIKTCGVGTYLVNGVCKIRPDQIKTSTITLTSAEPKIMDSNNRPVSIMKANDDLFVNVSVENLGKQTENFVASYRYISASTGEWSKWTWVSSNVNVGKYTDISIPWTPVIADDYEFDIQLWDNIQDKNIISNERLIVNVIPQTTSIDKTVNQQSLQELPKTIPNKILEKARTVEDHILIQLGMKQIGDKKFYPRVITGSLMTIDKGQENNINLKVTLSNGVCIIGQDVDCAVKKSTREPGAIYKVVSIDGVNYKVRYSGSDVRLEKFSILPESDSGVILDSTFNVDVEKQEGQKSRLYYNVNYSKEQ